MEQKGSTTFGIIGQAIGEDRTDHVQTAPERTNTASPDLNTPPVAGKPKRMSAFDRRVEELAKQRDAAEKAYQAELAKANKKHAVGYIRVSTTAQGNDDKYGPEVQRDAIIEYADQNGYIIDRWFYDTISGTSENRPALNQILYDNEVCNPPVEAVIAYKSDRIARDIKLYFYFLFVLEKRGIKLLSVKEQFDDDPYGLSSVYRALMLFVAEQERKNITLRTGGGRATKARQGGYCGGNVPYGYMNKRGTGRLEVVEDEAEMVRKIFKLLDAGWPMEDVADELNDMGYRTRSGKHFRFYHIRSIRDNRKFYEGYYKYGNMEEWVKGAHTAILDEIRPLVDAHDIPDRDKFADTDLKNRPL